MLRLAALALAALVSAPPLLADPAAPVEAGASCEGVETPQRTRKKRKLDRSELKRLKKELRSSDPKERTNALYDIAALTWDHDGLPTKDVAEALASALKDESLKVRSVAIDLLASGQHAETAVKAVISVMKGFEANMFTLVGTLIGPKGTNSVDDALRYVEITMHSAGRLPDDRVASALASVLLAYPTEMRGEPIAMAASESLLKFGTRDAVDAVVRQFESRPEPERARNIHDALASFAERSEIEEVPAADDEDLKKAWRAWAKENAPRLPKKLGKFKNEPREADGKEEDDGGRP
ncbi:MAG: hypothetical protein AAGB93_04215 [Planctomycetota bacterium]